MIKVYDDFFSEDTRKEIWDLLLRPKWAPDGGSVNNWFWHMDNLESEEYFSKYLYEIICDKLNINYKIGRIYANGQSIFNVVIHILMMAILLFYIIQIHNGN